MIIWLLGLVLMHGFLPRVCLSGIVQRGGHEAEKFVGEAGYTCPAEHGGQVAWGERWIRGAGGLLVDDLQDGGRAEVELVEEKLSGWNASSPSGLSAAAGKSARLAHRRRVSGSGHVRSVSSR
jgi:hypothetical protein